MKNIKFYKIFAAITCIAASSMNGMDQEKNNSLHKLVDGTRAVFGAAYLGAQRLYYGHATLLEQEIDDPNTPLKAWDAIGTTNKVNRALQELEGNPARATNLLIKINAYNLEHPNRPYNVSEVATTYVRSGIEQHYAAQESKALAEAFTRMANLQAQWRVELMALIAQSNSKEKELIEIASVLKLVKGSPPDLETLKSQFTRLHTLPTDLHAKLSAPEEEFSIDDTISSDTSMKADNSGSTSATSTTISPASGSSSSSSSANAAASDGEEDDDVADDTPTTPAIVIPANTASDDKKDGGGSVKTKKKKKKKPNNDNDDDE